MSDKVTLNWDSSAGKNQQMVYASTGVTCFEIPNVLKTYTVDEAVNKAGYGKFQIRLVFLSGLGWIADSFEIIILSLIGNFCACEWEITRLNNALLTSVVFIGMMFGCPLFGFVADRYGRKKALSVASVFLFIFGSLSAASPSFTWMMVLRALMGFALGGIPQAMTLCSEYFPTDIRAKAGFYLCYFWSAGTLGVILLSWVVMIQLNNWRVLLALAATPALMVILTLWWYPESARYFLVSGRHEEAEAVLYKMAIDNGQKLPSGRLSHVVQSDHRGSFRELLSREHRLSTLLFWYIWFAVSFSYYGIALMSPEIIRTGELRKTGNSTLGDGMSDIVPCIKFTNTNYLDLLWTSSAEFPGLIVFTFLVECCDRKKFMGGSCFLSGIFLFLLLVEIPTTRIVRMLFLFGARAVLLAIFQLVIIMTSEAFPTSVRAIAVGTGSMMCRIGGLLCPYVADILVPINPAAAIILLGASMVLAGIAALFLPRETRGASMIDIQDMKCIS